MRRCVTSRLTAVAAAVLVVGCLDAYAAPRVAAASIPPAANAVPTAATFSLNGASCAGVTCMVVGEEDMRAQVGRSFSERWNGAGWRQQAMPQPSRTTRWMSALNAVSCWSSRGCLAVGEFFPSCCQVKAFAEEWTGARWRIQRHVGPHVFPGYQLNGVSCPRARYCIAVGSGASHSTDGTVGLVEQWNRGRWRRDRLPSPGSATDANPVVNLTAVSCADRRDCVAIGSYSPNGLRSRVLVERYRDGRWMIQRPARPKGRVSDQLTSLSCPSSNACMAVGASVSGFVPGTGTPPAKIRPLAELWRGKRWRLQRLPVPAGTRSSLDRVACASPRSCTAVGEIWGNPAAAFGERWNGRVWRRQAITIASPSPELQFLGISCRTSRSCIAVGALAPDPVAGPLVAQSAGDHWTVRPAM